MSLPEILVAVKALPDAEKAELMQELVRELNRTGKLTPEEAMIAQFFPPGAVLHPGWQATTDEAGARVLQEALDEVNAKG